MAKCFHGIDGPWMQHEFPGLLLELIPSTAPALSHVGGGGVGVGGACGAGGGSGGGSGGLPAPTMPPWTAAGSTGLRRIVALSVGGKRDKLADRKKPYAHFRPDQVAITVLKAAVNAFHGVVEPLLKDGADLAHELGHIDWARERDGLLQSFKLHLIKIVAHLSLQRYVEHLACTRLPLKLAAKLVKDVGPAAVRKARKHGRVAAARLMLSTAAHASAVQYSTYVLVEAAAIALQECYLKPLSGHLPPPPKGLAPNDDAAAARLAAARRRRRAVIRLRLEKMVVTQATVYGCGVVGHALGTLLWPGAGTTNLGALCELGGPLLFEC